MNKYGAQRVQYNGDWYDSRKEAKYAGILDMLKMSNNQTERVEKVIRQKPFRFELNGRLMFTYRLDFEIHYGDGRVEYVDIKGYKKGCAYDLFRIKKKIIEQQYGIQIQEK